jgi:hypothetical protein
MAADTAPTPVSSTHLPKGVAERQLVECTKSLDISFDVSSPGLLIAVAATGVWTDGEVLPRPREDERAPHTLELIPPDGGAAVSTSESGESHLMVEVAGAGRWTARVTNLATKATEFGLFVSYPGSRELEFADLGAEIFADLADLRLEFHPGHQASLLELTTSAGPVIHYFTVDAFEYTSPWMPRVRGALDDVESTAATVSIPAGTPEPLLRYELAFEDEGVEITGTVPLNLTNMRLTLDLPIIVRYHDVRHRGALASVDYEESDVRATFSFDPQFAELVEWFPGFFPRWRRLIQRTVEKACRELFAAYELRQLFSDAIERHVLERIGQDAKPVAVAAADGKLRVSYYTLPATLSRASSRG